MSAPAHDPVNHPNHYTSHPSGIECIQVTRHMGFNLGNVVKYLWRAGLKERAPTLQDLKKAAWYLNDEIQELEEQAEREKARAALRLYDEERGGIKMSTPKEWWPWYIRVPIFLVIGLVSWMAVGVAAKMLFIIFMVGWARL